jgi:hypothetical protein
MGTPFILPLKGLRPWIERGLKAMVLVGLWLEEVLPGQLPGLGEMLPDLEEAELQEEVSLVSLGAMEDVVGQERLQQELLGVTLGGQLLEAQLEVVLVLGLEEVALDEQWRDPHPLTSEF